MWKQSVNLARVFRQLIYEISALRVCGIEIDIILHFTVGALIFAFVARRWRNRTACWALAICIVAKEIVDVFAKSSIEFIHMPMVTGKLDTIKDIAFGILGGLCAWQWQRRRVSGS